MSDASVRTALRSDARLVVIEAPAGCGKTYQGADYVGDLAASAPADRTLIVTHTHAACSVVAERTCGLSSRVQIRTIDSVIGEVASAYHAGPWRFCGHRYLGSPKVRRLWRAGDKGRAASRAISYDRSLACDPLSCRDLRRTSGFQWRPTCDCHGASRSGIAPAAVR